MSGSIIMDDNAQGIKVISDRVLLEFRPVEEKEVVTKKTNLVLPGQKQSGAGQAIGGSMGVKYRAYVAGVGEKVNLDDYAFKVGDWVIFNNMDVMGIDLPDPENPMEVKKYGLTRPESIWGLYETK